MWERIKEKEALLTPAFPSFSELQINRSMSPEYDLHMYLLILPKEVCDFPPLYIHFFNRNMLWFSSPIGI